jgi:hypothetical protein
MRSAIIILFAIVLTLTVLPAQARFWKEKSENADYLHRSIKELTDVMVHDIYSPPVACRTYAYVCIAAYEAIIPQHAGYLTFAGQLHQLKPVPKPASGRYSASLAAVQAILAVGKALVVSEDQVERFKVKLLQEFKDNGMPDEVFVNSIAYGQKVADHILAWASQDNYKQTRTFAKYAVADDPATWKPTPPAYIKAIEPHWNKIRTFVIDSAAQFKPLRPTPFSSNKKSKFYQEAIAVREMGVRLTNEQNEIANFWDCNPFKMNVRGHVMFATKKISPGGHWINITRLACKKANADLVKSSEVYATLAVTLADCFVSCWDEKYRSRVVRPETFINQYIDAQWLPLLQTPPFPEYTSGHSVVSAAASVVLSKHFGEKFSYTDSTEFEFGLPARNFTSFQNAAEEAAISRFYGGIHYMPSITNGLIEGREIGLYVTRKLRNRKEGEVILKKPAAALE